MFLDLVSGDCATALDLATGTVDEPPQGPRLSDPDRTMFVGVASTCLAAFGGRPDLWEDAAAALDAVDRQQLGCWYAALVASAVQVLEVHRQDPDITLVRGDASASFACPYLDAIDPSHGDPAGGYEIRISGRHLPMSLGIYVGDTLVTAQRQADGSLSVTAPAVEPSEGPVLVRVTVVGSPARGFPPTLLFTYDPAPSDRPSVVDSTSPTVTAPLTPSPDGSPTATMT